MRYRRHELLELMGWITVTAAAVWGTDGWLSRQAAPPADERRQAGAAAPAAADPDVIITGFVFLHVPPKPVSRPEWELRAGLAELLEARQLVVLHELHATFTSEREEGAMVLTGERGQLDLRQMNFEVIGEARPLTLEMEDRYRLTTTRLVWENGPQMLRTDRPIELAGGGLRMTGTGLEWSLADGTLAILQNVETVMTPI